MLNTRRRWQQQPPTVAELKGSGSFNGSGNSPYYKPELPADTHPPQELPLVRDAGYAVPPYEMSGDRAGESKGSREVGLQELKGGPEAEPQELAAAAEARHP